MKAFRRHLVRDGSKQRLVGRIASSEAIEPHAPAGQVELAADEPMAPVAADLGVAADDLDVAIFIGSTNEHHGAGERLGQIESPVLGEGPTWRSRLDASGRHVAVGSFRETPAGWMGEPTPDVSLPTPVVALDRGLEARFPRRGEHGCDAKRSGTSG